MKYQGSKSRIAKHIVPIMLKDRAEGQTFYDLTVGGGNLIDKIDGDRVGVDINPYVIEALKLIRDNTESLPRDNKEFTELDYKLIKKDTSIGNMALKGYVGFALSYGGKWFGGWCRDGQGKRDYVAEAYRNAIKQSKKIKGVQFLCASYDNVNIGHLKNLIVYGQNK